ncbi:MAG: mechanosensitive ion channel family protein [Leptolyngbyaceae cyanobacterium]
MPIALGLMLTVSPMLATSWAQTNSSSAPPPAAPVMLDGRELFKVQVSVGGYPPRTRALATARRIRAVAQDPNVDPALLSVAHDDLAETSNVTYDGDVLVYVTDADAEAASGNRRALAYRLQQLIADAIVTYRAARQPDQVLRGTLYALLVLLGTVLFLWLIVKTSGWVQRSLQRWKGRYISAVHFLGNEFLSAERVTDAIWEIFKLIRLGLLLIVLYVSWSQMLRSFPWTRPAGERLFDYIERAALTLGNHFVEYLPNLFFIALIAIATHYLLRIIRFLFTEIARNRVNVPGFFPQWANPTYNIVRVLVVLFAITMAFPYLPGSESPAFQGLSIFVGALFTLGSSGAIANLVAGIVLIYSRAYEQGDRVKISDAIGDVIDKSLMVTRLRTPKNVIITIPNLMVLSSHIVNYSASIAETQEPLIVHTTITLGYDVPWRQVHEVLIKAASKTDKILPTPPPFVLQTSLDDFYVSYELNAYTDHPKSMSRIFSELHQNLQDACNENNIEILSPHYGAMRDGNELAVPAKYWPPGYEPTRFRLETEGDRSNAAQS